MFLVIDTETNGIPQYKDDKGVPIPADRIDQPRLAQFAMIRCDENLNVQDVYTALIRPDGWEMTPETTAKNGLTTEYLNEHGFPVAEVLTEYQNGILEGRAVLAYGAQFDCKIMRGELRRAGKDDLFEQTKNACIMQSCMGVVKKPDGGKGWPKLEHACAHFGIVQTTQHRAAEDAEAARQIALHLKAIDRLKTPIVHHAKNYPGRDKSNEA